jgi:hypothetical protein
LFNMFSAKPHSLHWWMHLFRSFVEVNVRNQQTSFQASPRLWETSATADTVLPRKTSDLPWAVSNGDVLHEGWRGRP